MSAKPMNVIVITSDEMRGEAPGFLGNPDCRTPNLDRLAQRGVAFENQFAVHGKCLPSRVSMVTGRYSHTDGFRSVMEENLLSEDQPDLLGRLKQEGYESAVFGLNHVWETLFASNKKGGGYTDYHSFTEGVFDDLAKQVHEVPSPGPESRSVREDLVGKFFDYRGRKDRLEGFCDENRTAQALRYLKEVRDPDRPFYLHLNLSQPHPPYAVEEPYFSMYDRESIQSWPHQLPDNAPEPLREMRRIRTGTEVDPQALREIQATYYGMVTKVDTLVGKVVDCLETQGLMDNSIVLFWVDHGDFAGQYGLVEKWDTAMNDCILHVPMILCAPSLPRGHRVSGLTEHVDVAPTILELLGIDPDWYIHGRSLLETISGGPGKEYIFADGGHEQPMLERFANSPQSHKHKPEQMGGKQLTYLKHPTTMARTKMVRSQRYKLVVRESGGNELYDLRQDPWELHNLYGQPGMEQVVLELQHQMLQWCLRTDPDQPHLPVFGA